MFSFDQSEKYVFADIREGVPVQGRLGYDVIDGGGV